MLKNQLRKTYRDEIYNYKPAWILRWGVSCFFSFLLLIVIVASFVKYPDIVPATVEITTINPPAHIVAKINGKIEEIYRGEGEAVQSGSIIVELESSGEWNDIEELERYVLLIDSMIKDTSSRLTSPSFFRNDLELGEIQNNYAQLIINYDELYLFSNSGLFEAEYISLKIQKNTQFKHLKHLLEKKDILNEQYQFILNKNKRDSLLYTKEVIAKEEIENNHQYILQFRLLMLDLNINILTAKSNIESLLNDIKKTELNHKKERRQLITNLTQNLRILNSNIESWKQKYLIISPITGYVSYTNFWSKNQNVKIGETVVSVIPKDSMSVRVRLKFPIQNSGKVKNGNRVNIKLKNYPYQEYGMLVGKIVKISKVTNDNFYSADVELEKGLITSYGKELPNGQQLYGDGEILTDDLNLLVRFVNPLRAILDENN